jgi:hypothetical protein
MATNNKTKKEYLVDLYTIVRRYPAKRTRVVADLEKYGLTVDDFTEYENSILNVENINILEQRAKELEDIPGFSQIDTMSDDEILRVFQARDELNDKLADIGKPPSDAEWYTSGLAAEQRIERLRDPYDVKKEEEWARLEYPADPIAPLMGPIGLLTELVAGGTDWRYDFKEKLHERGAFTSWNPLTGFGAWDIAEFKVDPDTGERGFSADLLQMEDELEQLYGTKKEYTSKMIEGGYRDVSGIKEEIGSLNQIIIENELLDPRLLGETQ